MENWRRLEKDLARKIHGYLTIGSGNKWQKGDAQNKFFLVEAKWRSPVLDLSETWLITLLKHATARNKKSVLGICCDNYWTLAMLPLEDWPGQEDYSIEEVVDCTNKKQHRMYPYGHYHYKQFDFKTAGSWIVIPLDDLISITRCADAAGVDKNKEEEAKLRHKEKLAKQREWCKRKYKERKK
jgi:hypothetical protein